MDQHEMDTIRKSCTRFLTHGYPKTPQQVLAELADMVDLELDEDRYGEGALINDFEKRVADLMGKEAAVFMPSGTMCQQIVMRIWSERRGTKNVAFHPKSHLEIHEQSGYRHLHGLHGILVGNPDRLLTLAQLQAIPEPLGAVLIELPQREIGGVFPCI
jgi:threonine aldolase